MGMRAIRLCGMLLCLAGPAKSVAGPAHDAFADAGVLPTFPGTATGTTAESTLEPQEPWPGRYVEGSVWFSWTASTSGTVQVDTQGSASETHLAVWQGGALTSLTEVAQNYLYDGDGSLVLFNAAQGTTYRIAVYGISWSWGSFRLRLTNGVGASISGTVRDATTGAGLPGIDIAIRRWEPPWWEWQDNLHSDATGSYHVAPLPPGTYRVDFNRRSADAGYEAETYDNAAAFDDGMDIVLADGDAVQDIDASLAPASRIRGRVTAEDGGSPIGNVFVAAYRTVGGTWTRERDSATDTNGLYEIGSLPADTYRVAFDTVLAHGFSSEAYDDAADVASGTDIPVASNTVVSHIDAALAAAPAIAGTVTGPDGVTRLGDVEVRVLTPNGPDWDWAASTQTDTNGEYKVFVPRPGVYRVAFFPGFGSPYIEQYYDQVSDIDSGTDVVTSNGVVRTGVDARLATSASISGRVTGPDGSTPLEGIDATAYVSVEPDWGSYRSAAGATTASNGFYTISGLAAGTYRVQFRDSSWAHISRVYSNGFWVSSSDATDIVLAHSESRSNVNMTLQPASWIAGRVTDAQTGTAIAEAGVFAQIQVSNGWQTTVGVFTDDEGLFRLTELESGTYRVWTQANGAQAYLGEYYDDAPMAGDAESIELAAYASRSGLEIGLLSVSNAAPSIVSVRPVGSGVYRFDYLGYPGATYVLQESASPTGTWRDVGDYYGANGDTNTMSITPIPPWTFWRMRYVP